MNCMYNEECNCRDGRGTQIQSCRWRIMSDHLFLPRKLSLIHCEEAGHLLGVHFLRFLKDSDIQDLTPTVNHFVQFASKPPTTQQLVDSCKESNFLVAVPLIDHNAVLLFNNRQQASNASSADVLVSAFDVLPHVASIHSTSSDTDPYPSACQMLIPRRSLTVQVQEVRSEAFLDQVAALGSKAEFPLREPKAWKAGHEVTETRKPAVPTYVFDWLMHTLQLAPSSKTPEAFTKRIRLDSVRQSESAKPWTRSMTWVALKSLVQLCLVQLHGFPLGTCLYKCNMLRYQSLFVCRILQLHQTGKCRRDFGELREMCAYLTKKAEKLQRCFPSCTELLKDISQTCELVDRVLSAEWAQYLQSEKDKNQIDLQLLTGIDYSSDTWNPLTNSRGDLVDALSTDSVVESTIRAAKRPAVYFGPPRRVHQVHLTSQASEMQSNPRPWMDQLIQDLRDCATNEDLERALQLTETFIRVHLWPHHQSRYNNREELLDVAHRLLLFYQQRCVQRYAGDPIRLSKMVLYCCTLVVWMDSVVLEWDPLQLLRYHQLSIIAPNELQALLLMDVADVRLLQEVHDRILERTTSSLSPGILDSSRAGLAYAYAWRDASMLWYERAYFEEVERLTRAKEAELARAKSEYHDLEFKMKMMKCTCLGWYWRSCCSKCSLVKTLKKLEHSVSIYERRLPDDDVQRRVLIFHHLMPRAMVHLMESCAFLVSICGSCASDWHDLQGSQYQWAEVDYSRRIAVGSSTKSFLNCHYGKNPSILTSSSNFIVPQGKNVKSALKLSYTHMIINNGMGNCLVWNLSGYCQLAIGSPFHDLTFTAHGTGHTENDVLAIQCQCPANLELISFKEFGTLRAGGYLQWRNLATAFEGSALDLNSLPVSMLFLQAAYQVGPLPVSQHWNFDLNEQPFVHWLCDHIASVVHRIERNWSAHRVLFVCVSILVYIVQHAAPETTSRALELLALCRQTSTQWSHAVQVSISQDAKQSMSDPEKVRSLLYVNCLVILTFPAGDRCSVFGEEELFQLLRARTIMFERKHVARDGELERIASLSSRVMASFEQRIHQLLSRSNCGPLSRVATDRWPQCKPSSWSRVADRDFYQGVCSSGFSAESTLHFNIFDGTFLVDGEPIGRLPDRVLSHRLFTKSFPSANVPALHRGGGVHQTTGLTDAVYTFALLESGCLLVREERNGRTSRLIDPEKFRGDLPEPLVLGHSFWMTYDGSEHHVELRRPDMFQADDFRPIFRIDLNDSLHGRVTHLQTERLMLNFRGRLFAQIFDAFVWRLDIRSYVIPYLPRASESGESDPWSLCLYLQRLHQHIEVYCGKESVKIQVREFDNMVVAADQFLGTFVGLRHLLVLQRPNGMRTAIVPYLPYRTELVGPHLALRPKDATPNSRIPFFSFDEDRSLKQMRPHGSDTLAAWLMCAYLHAVTTSAMRDPLTGLTGLEMAVTQLRRCYTNKPMDASCIAILKGISLLSPERRAAYDTEVVCWDANRSAYSSSEVYRLLIQLIYSKSLFLQQLHLTQPRCQELEKPIQFHKKAYTRYDWSVSMDSSLSQFEKEQLHMGPIVVPEIQVAQTTEECSIIRKLAHSVACQKTLNALLPSKPFDWAEFLQQYALHPVQMLPPNVAIWSTCIFETAWLSLCTEALKLTSAADPQRLKRFTLLLSFMVWSNGQRETVIRALLEMALSTNAMGSRDVLGRYPLPPTAIAPGPRTLSLDAVRVLLLAARTCVPDGDEYETVKAAFNRDLGALWSRITLLGIWRPDMIPTDTKAHDPFRYIFTGLELGTDFKENKFIAAMTEYYHDLFYRQQIYQFATAVKRLYKEARASPLCYGNCPTPVASVLVKCRPMELQTKADKKQPSYDAAKVIHGKCEELERQFQSCLSTRPVDGGISEFPLNFGAAADEESIAGELLSTLRDSWIRFHESKAKDGALVISGDVTTTRAKLLAIEEHAKQLVQESWHCLQSLMDPDEHQWLGRCRKASGLVSFAAPRTLFPRFGRAGSELSTEARSLLGHHLVYVVYAQKATRCLEMVDVWQSTPEEQRQHFSQRLIREMAEPHCEGWSPEQYPKWLLFEVEGNVLIRRIQAQFALKIIRGEEQILQLNMGEGKTSVISPLVCSSLADGKHVVQLTLLTSLLETHGLELALKLSGLLEQLVFYFPCRRDVRFDGHLIERMMANLRECVQRGGCIVTVPEHRLSLRLKMEEMSIQSTSGSSGTMSPEVRAFLQLFQLQRTHLIDLVDESDEILRHKYQLLYTMGSQAAIDGGERRWKVLQGILGALFPPNGTGQDEEACTIPVEIARLQLNREDGEARLVERVFDDVFSGRIAALAYFAILSAQTKEKIRSYFRDTLDSADELNELKRQLTDLQFQDVLIVRGLLCFGVLPHSLKKRWSVDYGVDVITKRRLMAVPFRGKDTPMPRTEFGHPDVSLVLTHLSYYHTGLDGRQVTDALRKLKQLPQRETVYREWTKAITGQRPHLPADANSINFDDLDQLKVLSLSLRYNRSCIHFWLNCCVLPKETRQFPFKLMATSWDLASEHAQPLRGFSGTKDSSYLLPSNVRLGSLPQLAGTDGDVLSRVTDATNRRVHNLSVQEEEITARSVIDFIVDCGKGNILIDCGALMVGMTNRQVAEYWLSKAPSQFMAAAYFRDDKVVLLLRNGHETPLNYSPLKGRLSSVLIYMDDVHTRGTDFRFAIPSHGYVTLGRNLPKDKLVQACMRMRQLGHGHSIAFLCPHEVYVQLQKVSHPEPPQSPHVIQWALQNTIAQIQNGLLEWASQGLHFSRRVTADKVIGSQLLPHWTEARRLHLFVHLVQVPEQFSLTQMYEAVQSSLLATRVVEESKNVHVQSLSSAFRQVTETRSAAESQWLCDAENLASALVAHCRKYLGRMELKSKCLEEEQEKELEEEEEREVHRPGRQSPYKPQYPTWIDSLRRCQPVSSIREFRFLWHSMERTTTRNLLSAQSFDPRILVTYNYCRTLQYEISVQDEFVRPPRWMLVLWQSKGNGAPSVQHVILVCPFEANALVPQLRGSQLVRASLHRFAPRTRRDQRELLTSDLTVWSGGQPAAPWNVLKRDLHFGVMALTLFGCSTCLQSNPQLERSMADCCIFMNIVPPPGTCAIGFDDSDWDALLKEGWIDSEGFITRTTAGDGASGVSEAGRQLLQRMLSARHWQRSPAAAIRALVPIRDMAAFFQSSDMAFVLYSP